ncbi:MAG: nitroreductase family deazaflavin-dependent oxidoreductase [Gammaproteobacteria bacterium]|nr:nitroreductase family deazaflavin-dependent oxidoreductase [Gammaproteobacteria bacterium]
MPANLPQWITDHIKLYVDSDGAEGHIWNGVPTLLITTMGRKSRAPQMIPLIYGRDGDDHVIVASRGGDVRHPAWYLNLVANASVKVQVGPDKFTATARTVSAAEKQRLWPIMTKVWPAYDEYQAKTARDIPVVVLTRNP